MADIYCGDDVADMRRIKSATENADPLTRFTAHRPQLTAAGLSVLGRKSRKKYRPTLKKPTVPADG